MIGSHISHYLIEAKLGEGGMGVVFRARDTKLNRQVALKLLPVAVAESSEELGRFKLEAQAAAALNHTNIATIYEINDADGRQFIAMELVDGQTLDRRLASGPLDPKEAIRIAREVALGLAEAHDHGVVHRDIKPANIMLTGKGQVKILDFGLAKMAHTPGITRAGSTLGTPSYMSPEQAQSGVVDHRSDIWSLGVILYQMLTGRRPFDGEHEAAVVYAIVHEPLRPMSELRPDLPKPLAAIVEKALAKNADERYGSAGEMEEALSGERAVATNTRTARPLSSGRRKVLPWLCAAAAVLIGAFAIPRFWPSSPRGSVVESLAVMPLTYAAADSTTEYLADGISESIISNLSRHSELRVMSWFAVRRMKGKELSPAEIADKLDVHAVLMGHLKPDGEQLRLSLELIDARDQRQIWGDQYEGPVSALLDLQSGITSDVYRQLRSGAQATEPTPVTGYTTRNSDAYAHYLKGRFFWNKFTPENAENSIKEFQQALDLDPTFALAYTGLADSWTTVARMSNSTDAVEKARAYALQALKLDPDLAEAHYSLATIYYFNDWDWDKADAALDRAVELNPNHAFAYQLMAVRLWDAGHIEASVERMSMALKLDPLSHRLNCGYGGMLVEAGKYAEAVKQAKQTLQLEQTCPFEHMVQGLGYVGIGQYDLGFAQLDTALAETENRLSYRVGLIRAHMIKGDTTVARRLFDSLLAIVPAEVQAQNPYTLAELFASMGDNDLALTWLEKAYEVREPNLTAVKTAHVFEHLRSNPRFRAIVEKMGLQT